MKTSKTHSYFTDRSSVIVEAILFQPGLWLEISEKVKDTDLETLPTTSLTTEIILMIALV